MIETKTYDCGRCANKRTPMCNACTVVTAPDGTVSKPKYFVKLSDKEIHTIGSGDSDISEDLALYIVRSIELGVPIPIALIMLWNRKREAEE